MGIHQLNATYVRAEDRILLRVTLTEGDEYRFWLTRAALREFLGQADAWLGGGRDSPAAAVQGFQREAAAARADFATPMGGGENFPLGEAPLLVEAMAIESEGPAVRLELRLADRRLATLHLDEPSLAGVQRLLREAAAAAEWGLATAPGPGMAPPAGHLH